MKTAEIIVAGAINLDVKAISSAPTRRGRSTPGSVSFSPGGVARNVAEALARLRRPVKLLGVVGEDPWGQWVSERTAAAGVDMTYVKRKAGSTGCYVAMNGQGVGDTALLETMASDEWRAVAIQESQLLVLDANLTERVLSSLAARAARLALVGTSPAKVRRLRNSLAGTWMISATMEEAQALLASGSGRGRRQSHARRSMRRLAQEIARLGPAHVLLTGGPRGFGLLTGGQWSQRAAPEVRPIDPTGAGDTATAVVIAGLLSGINGAAVVELAWEAASMTLRSALSVPTDLGDRIRAHRIG